MPITKAGARSPCATRSSSSSKAVGALPINTTRPRVGLQGSGHPQRRSGLSFRSLRGAHCKTLWTGLEKVRAAIGAARRSHRGVGEDHSPLSQVACRRAAGARRETQQRGQGRITTAMNQTLQHLLLQQRQPSGTQQGLDPLDAFREDRMVQARR